MRKKLEEIGIELHPDKFYIQYYTRGIELVGTVVKPERSYVHNRTVHNAFQAIQNLNKIDDTEANTDKLVSTVNSYLGFMKSNCSYSIRRNLLTELDKKWWDLIYVDADFWRIILRKKYNDREKTRQEIINNQQLNKRKTNGKAKTN